MEFTASIEHLREALQWILAQLKEVSLSSSVLSKIELVSEEALVNIIDHAYQGRPETVEIEVNIFPNSHLEIIFKDHGAFFNPLTQAPADLSSDLEERTVGGLGIHFIRSNVDEINYQRKGKLNILTLRKIIRSSQMQ